MRKEQELTLERLAFETGVGKGFLCEIEQGLAMPSLTTLSRLAERLELPLYDLVIQPDRDGARARICEHLRKLPATLATRVLRQVEVEHREIEARRARRTPASRTARPAAARRPRGG